MGPFYLLLGALVAAQASSQKPGHPVQLVNPVVGVNYAGRPNLFTITLAVTPTRIRRGDTVTYTASFTQDGQAGAVIGNTTTMTYTVNGVPKTETSNEVPVTVDGDIAAGVDFTLPLPTAKSGTVSCTYVPGLLKYGGVAKTPTVVSGVWHYLAGDIAVGTNGTVAWSVLVQ